MHFKMSKSAYSLFENIMNTDGSHTASDKNKFMQFDIYYCCAMIGMSAIQLDTDSSDLRDIVEKYPKPYNDYKAHIAGLLIATEAKRQGINPKSSMLEEIMLKYLSDDDTMLSEEGIKTLNAYALKGYNLLHEYPLSEKPTSREEFLEAFSVALKMYEKDEKYFGLAKEN